MDRVKSILVILLALSIAVSGYLYLNYSELNSDYKELNSSYQQIRNNMEEYENYGNIRFKMPVDSKVEAIATVVNSEKYESFNQRKGLSARKGFEGNPIDVTYVPESSNLPNEYKEKINMSLPVYGVEFLPISQNDRMSGAQKPKFSTSYGFYVNQENGNVKGPLLNDYYQPFP